MGGFVLGSCAADVMVVHETLVICFVKYMQYYSLSFVRAEPPDGKMHAVI